MRENMPRFYVQEEKIETCCTLKLSEQGNVLRKFVFLDHEKRCRVPEEIYEYIKYKNEEKMPKGDQKSTK